MKTSIIIMAAFALTLVGCSNLDSDATATAVPTQTQNRPTNYIEASAAAVTPITTAPPAPSQCVPVKVYATPGTSVTIHSYTINYTITADGNGFVQESLRTPGSIIWITVNTNASNMVTWTGVEFLSADNFGATWTIPTDTTPHDIRITVMAPPSAFN